MSAVFAEGMPTDEEYVNSIGMRFVRIEPGSFTMGQKEGRDLDESPVHKVNITRPFYMAATEVTNAQYEQFRPEHSADRGRRGVSKEDGEAVAVIDWQDAVDFCEWLSKKDGIPYRLPTEAEWEYACRAGTTTQFYVGEELPEEYLQQGDQDVSLRTGASPANPWGLYDMHGNVEEWCQDWYGPYVGDEQTDPVGRESGLFRVTRGGSHSTEARFLRSASRLGALPEDKNWLIGFRVVLGELPATKPLPEPKPKLWACDVKQGSYEWDSGPDPDIPYFSSPISFVRYPENREDIPMYSHNHCPAIAWCPNGDLLAVWFSTEDEGGRELTILGSRLRAGNDEWDFPSEFFKAPDRNMTGSALFNDDDGKIYYFNSIADSRHSRRKLLVIRTSTDNGATWSKPRSINAYHETRHQAINNAIRTREGYLIQPCDSVGGGASTAIHISRDNGNTWTDPRAGEPCPNVVEGGTGGAIAGIHGAVVQLLDGRLLGFGRGNDIGPRMPMSISSDMGKTWTYSASEFPPIGGGQRVLLLRLREGPILFISFTDGRRRKPNGMLMSDGPGEERLVHGMFAALSFDEARTWPVKKLITAGDPARELNGGAWTRNFVMDATHAEPGGYLAITQTPDGVIHLISSAIHYRFNLAWLKQPMPAE